MSGILSVEKRKTYRLLSEEFPEEYVLSFFTHGILELPDDLQDKIYKGSPSDFASDDNISKNSQKQVQNIRFYFQKEGIVYSIYDSIFKGPNVTNYHLAGKYAVFLMTEEEFAGAIIKKGEIVLKKNFNNSVEQGTSKKSSRSGQQKMLADTATLLKSWQAELSGVYCIFVSCPKEYTSFLQEETTVIHKGYKIRRYLQKIPFAINGASLEELDRVWEKLFSVVEHGPINAFTRAVETGHFSNKLDDPNEDVKEVHFVGSTKQQRRDEKQRWPGINPQKKTEIHEALLSNHYEVLQDLIGKDPEIIDYLSQVHEKLGGQAFMHLAVKENHIDTVQFLFDAGCNPSVQDDSDKVPYEYAKTIEMKQTFVDFRKEQPEAMQWTKSRIPEVIDVPKPAAPKNTKTNVQVKTKPSSGKSKKKQTKYVNMIDDEFDYDDDVQDLEDEEFCPAQKNNHRIHNVEELPKKLEEVDLEKKKLRTHSLLEAKWSQKNSSPFDYPRTANSFDIVRKTKSNSEDLKRFVEQRMQPEVRMYFVDSEVLFSGYSAMLGSSYCSLRNTSLTPHAVLLINEEYFAGAAIDNGVVSRRKTLHRSGANWTKIRDPSKNNSKNRLIEDKLAECIEYVFKYWTADLEVKVLFSCPPDFEMIFKLHILETHKRALFDCIPFPIEKYTNHEVDKVWKNITTVTEHGSAKIFETALEAEDFSLLEEMLEDPKEVVLAVDNEQSWQYFSTDQLQRLYRAFIKNDYDNLEKVVNSLGYYFNRWGVSDALGKATPQFGWQTYLHWAVKGNYDQTVKFLLDKCRLKFVRDKYGKLPIDYCQNTEMRSLFTDYIENDDI